LCQLGNMYANYGHKHSTLFLIGHFYFAFFLDVYKTNFVEMFEVFYTYFRIEIRLASLPARSVVPLYRYWFPHFRCDGTIWNNRIIEIGVLCSTEYIVA